MLEARGEIGVPYKVEDVVGAILACPGRQRLDHILLPIVDDQLGAEFADERRLGRAGHRGRDPRAAGVEVRY